MVVGPCSTLVRSIWSNAYGATRFANAPAPKMTTSPKSPIIARRWRKNLRRAYDHWLRVLTSMPSAAATFTSAATASGMPFPSTSAGGGPSSTGVVVGSVIANPRVEEAVQDVGQEVEDDHRDRDDHDVGHHRVDVIRLQARDEEVPHSVERENRLGDDRAAEQRAELERGDRDDGNKRISDDVPEDHQPFRQSLRTGRAHVVAVDHVQHRRAHVPAVQRKADD